MGDVADLERLEKLLNKPRTVRNRELVRAVMVQPIGITDRIERIEMVDLLAEDPPLPELPSKPRGNLVRPTPHRQENKPKSPPPPLVDPTLDEVQRVEHHRRHLGMVPARGGLLTYLFKHYVPLALWGDKTGALDRGWFPFTLKLGREPEIFLRRTLWADLVPLVRTQLAEVLDKAWATLTKEEYNLLAAADLLCRILDDLPRLPVNVPVPPGFLDAALGQFALFLTGGGRAEDLVTAWDRGALYVGKPEKTRHLIREALRLLVESRPGRTSLATAVQALLALRTWRSDGLSVLVPEEPGEYFPKDSFEASPKVLAEIQRTVDQVVKQAEGWSKELKEIKKVRWFLPEGPLLETFLGSTDPQVPLVWCQTFLDKLLPASGPLVGSLHNPHLTSVMGRLEELRGQIGDPQRRLDPDLPAAVARVSTNLGKNLANLVRARCRTIDPLVIDDLPDPAPLPLENESDVLESPEEWGGLTVAEALVQTARVALAAGKFLGEGSIDAILGKQPGLETKLNEALARLDRLAPASVAARAREG